MELGDKRILIFVVAYNAETTLESVLGRIPESLQNENVEVLVIDDSSQDETFFKGVAMESSTPVHFRITTLRTPENQGYGGNQKLGYQYAIEHGFDIVALVHGDGQYAPEKLPELLEPLLKGDADAVFGSRMIEDGGALRGGMPYYKWLGNKVLTTCQNAILGTHLSEFHSGYRLYSVDALRIIPFSRNSNDFHFDTEIIIQLVLRSLRIVELPIPTYYGDEICHVNGLAYAWNVMRAMLRARFHEMNLLYDRKFDVGLVEETYDLKLGFSSSHTMAIAAAKPGAKILDMGCGRGYVADEFAKKGATVVGIDQYAPDESVRASVQFRRWDLDAEHFPVDLSEFDQIFMLDIIEHLKDPEIFMEKIRDAAARKRSELIITTANIGFFVTRFMLLFGHFNYGRKGILDRTHTRLFTFESLHELLEQAGYRVLEMRGIPAPYPLAIGLNWISRAFLALNEMLMHVSRGLFAYQIYVRAQAQPTVPNLLAETIDSSDELRKKAAAA